ncbi:PilZ domain-containing protein [Gilvimarinus agarilyticus]|uniref:PilZ domain-containing protein n=1 Tax=unclassified Gilvimarinus TaxID=2642066 RepID=UPI001C0843F4|nr:MULTISPECIES: PilZ domain-containing protein [unclassified Gilvimarinus]MBU2884395.1 PilZ domain-containing protein [Gilvimarinus agarilyticus]MDO6569531.1 PilZ domain-containing protein [Gilvimarinus sp. 2_MG-2023]MDO6748143.1 PilZ domain-containing protein [Gilvimarinus sp. 1_MG-2023]
MSHATTSPDQRQEYRLNASETVYLELEAGQDNEPAKIVISRSTDLSANGLQVELDRPLPAGHIYPLCIQLQNPEVRFVLTGEVKWCRSAVGRYQVGIALFESDNTAIQAWKEEVARRLAAQ